MLILLPPSEGKNQPARRKKLNLKQLSFAGELTEARISALGAVEVDENYCDRASHVYSGVLYQALDLETLSPAARQRASKSVLIISALFGVLHLDDVIPNYKSKISTSNWKEPLARTLNGMDEQLVVDMRSSTYLSAWVPNPENTVGIRIFTKVNGERKVITHMSKKYRGEIARYLLQQRTRPTTPNELNALLKEEFTCTLIKQSGKQSWFIDVIV